jgi:hypothetical protein
MDIPTIVLDRTEIDALPKVVDFSHAVRGVYTSPSTGQLILVGDSAYPDGAVIAAHVESVEIPKVEAPVRLGDDHVPRYKVKKRKGPNKRSLLTYSEAFDAIIQTETWNIEDGKCFVRPACRERLLNLNSIHKSNMARAGRDC